MQNQADGLFLFVWTAIGDPLGNVSLLHRGASVASLEQRRKSGLLNISDSSFFPLLPSCLSFVKDATENTERSAEKHRSPAAWREFYSYMTRSFSVINIARAEIKDFLKF